MHILVTRPRPDADELEAALLAAGHRVTLAPLAEVAAIENLSIELSGVAALAVTSRNALRVLRGHPALAEARRLPLFAVGTATATLAREMGFSTVVTGAGRAADLVQPIAEALAGRDGLLLHLSGETIAFDLVGALSAAGVAGRRVVVYRAESIEELPADAIAALCAGQIHGVILMSPAAARQWRARVQAHGLSASVRAIVHFCLSEAVAAPLTADGVEVAVAAAPRLEELLALVALVAANSNRRP